MEERVLALASHLRQVGVPVSSAQVRDTVRAIRLAGPPHALRVAAMTLVARTDHRSVLTTVGPLFLGPGPARTRVELAEHVASLDEDRLREFLVDVLRRRDHQGLAAAAHALVDRHVTIIPTAPVAGNVHVLRAYRAAGADLLRDRLEVLDEPRPQDPLAPLRARLSRTKADEALSLLRHAIEVEIRRRLVDHRGAAQVARAVRAALPEDVDILTASVAEVTELTSALTSLPSRIEQRLERTGHPPAPGRLDPRTTLRRSMSTGGVPLQPVFHPRRPPRPELVVLADISGSVASFARFTLALTHALHGRFRGLRSFVFVDGVDEITDLLGTSGGLLETAEMVDRAGLGVHLDGRSDYGRVLSEFWSLHGHRLHSRTVVLVLGDARSNFRPARVESLRALARRVGRLYWLNPERRSTWADGDSLMATYAPECHGVHEVRSARQLEQFVLHHLN